MGIHRLLHSSCCFLNINTAITRQLIRTARTLEAECWQVCGNAWVWGQRKMSQVLGAFGLLHFTMLRPFLVWRAFWNVWTVYFFNFTNFLGGRSKPRIRGCACILVLSRVVDGQISRDTPNNRSRTHQWSRRMVWGALCYTIVSCAAVWQLPNTLNVLYIIVSSACPREEGCNLITFYIRPTGRHVQWAMPRCWQEVR